jgi:hypothetical protein
MRTETTYDPATPYVLQHRPLPPQLREPDNSRCHLLANNAPSPAAHDATLLAAALEDLEAQRVALEWLLEADLLCACLV